MKRIITGILTGLLLCIQSTAMDLNSLKSQNTVKKMVLGENGKVITELQLKHSEPLQGSPEQQVQSFIQKYNSTFNIDFNDLKAEIRNKSKAADVVIFRQFKNGLPVFDGTIHAVLKNNQLQILKNRYKYTLNSENKQILDKNEIVNIARNQIENSISVTSDAEMGYYNGKLCYRIDISAPKAHYRTYVDASDGTVLFKRNMLHFAPTSGTGKVYNPNPIASSGNTTLMDNNDATSTVLDNERFSVTLSPLDGSGYLVNQYVNMKAPGLLSPGTFGYTDIPSYSPGQAYSDTSTFDYTRDEWAFEEVNIFYWVTETIKDIQDNLGFPAIMDYSIPIDAHYMEEDQSFFSEGDKGLHMGDGGVDDGEDVEIILHELGHAITHDIIPGFAPPSAHEANAMDEGNSDFYAASFGPDTRYPTYIGEWDASSYDSNTPPYLRRIDSTKHYPENMTNYDFYADSAIWSSTLWQIRVDLGKDVTNEIFIESLTYLEPNATFEDGANAILLADQNLNGGANYTVIRQYFVDRGILSTGSYPEDSYTNHIYFPLALNNSDFVTYLGLINPGTQTTHFKINFVDSTGHVVGTPVTGSLNAMARQYDDIDGFLTDAPATALWIMVGFDNTLDGYVNLLSKDSQKSCFVKASKSLEEMVYVPHIAFKNSEYNYWYSYTSVINGTDTTADVQFNYLNGISDMTNPSTPFSQYYFDWYEDFYERSIPANFPDWGILEADGAKIAGMEMFTVKQQGVHQLGGLDLGSESSDTLYFGHVDTGGDFWWTGFAIENVSEGSITVDITPYSEDGTALTPVSYTMAANEKIVKLVEYFWTDKGLTYPATTAWVRVEGSGQMIGYELFGTYNSKLLAGINAPAAGGTSLLYPHVQTNTQYYTGITVVNIGTESTTLTARGYTTYGEKVIEEVIVENFVPNQKFTVEASSMFSSQIPSDVVSIVLEGDQPMIGFELWINHQNAYPDWDYMSGMLAINMDTSQSSGSTLFRETFSGQAVANSTEFSALTTAQAQLQADNTGYGIYTFDDNTEDLLWVGSGHLIFTDGTNNLPWASDPDTFAAGWYGDGTTIHHSFFITKEISIPATGTTTLSFDYQFNYPGDATGTDYVWITTDLNIDDGLDNSQVFTAATFTDTYIKSLSAVDGNTTAWYNSSVDISSFAGQKIRIAVEVYSYYGEAFHVDNIVVRNE